MTMRFVTTLVAVSAGLAALVGCGDGAGRFAESQSTAVGTLVVGWSEAEHEVIKPHPDNPVMCAWSPTQVDVWQVPRADLADDVRLTRAVGG